MTEIGVGCYMGKISKGLPPPRRPKLSKKHKIRRMKLKKLYEAYKWWKDWKLQFHWHKLEWINSRSKIKRKQPFSVSSKHFYINKNDRTSHGVGHSDPK